MIAFKTIVAASCFVAGNLIWFMFIEPSWENEGHLMWFVLAFLGETVIVASSVALAVLEWAE